jgi:hypothetical protein
MSPRRFTICIRSDRVERMSGHSRGHDARAAEQKPTAEPRVLTHERATAVVGESCALACPVPFLRCTISHPNRSEFRELYR